VFEKRTETREERAEELLEEIPDPEDISVFPMGIPMIAGPGTMASLLILSSDAGSALPQQAAIMSALALVLILTLLAFLIAGPLMKLMGKTFTISKLSRTVLRSASSVQATNLPSREDKAIPQ